MKIKTIDVNVKEWFDKVNGNSYFAGTVIVNYQMKSEKRFLLPFQYGYDDHYRDMAFKLLCDKGIIKGCDRNTIHWHYYRDNKIIARHSKEHNCLKRELTRLTV